jgi:hypothetical protein
MIPQSSTQAPSSTWQPGDAAQEVAFLAPHRSTQDPLCVWHWKTSSHSVLSSVLQSSMQTPSST